jgi:hypothetical protein
VVSFFVVVVVTFMSIWSNKKPTARCLWRWV